MRVVLVNPCVESELQRHRLGIGHLGLGYVAACLRQAGHEVRVVDAKLDGLGLAATVGRVLDLRPEMVGLTAMTHEITYTGSICRAIKEASPACVTVVGGPHASAMPEGTLAEFADIDVAVRGEGERTACEVAQAAAGSASASEWSRIQGIAYRQPGRILRNPDRPFITDLDSVPFPAWDLFPRPRGGWPLYAGRGCPFRCSFCQRVLGGRIRLRSVDNVMAEIDALEQATGQRQSWFQDETFGVSRKWTDEMLDRLIERNRRRGYVWHWKANSRANLADVAIYRKMRAAGCRMLDFGVESGSPLILERIHKSITLDQARRAIRAARAAGLRTNAFFIIGHPGETWATAMQTVRFAARLRADSIAVGVMVPYPGTEIWELAGKGEWGYRLISRNWQDYDKYFGNALSSKYLTHKQMEFLQALTYVWFYVGAGRFRELFEFVSRFSGEAMRMVCRLVRPG